MGKINVTGLDFTQIKQNLIDFFRSQPEWQDYDFASSGLSYLIDALAFNALYSAYYTNMVANEMFLDSGVLRSSVVSRAKEIGYTPTSTRSAIAYLNLNIDPDDDPATVLIPKGALFSSVIDGVTYTFSTVKATLVTRSSGEYVAEDVEVAEGEPLTHRFVVDLGESDQRFVIPNAGVDTSLMTVKVQNSSTNLGISIFQRSLDLNEAGPDSEVYWLQEVEDGLFEIYFGDGVVGKALENGNIVIVEYLVSSGPDANGCNAFEAFEGISGYPTTVETSVAAFGGRDRESIESIKFLAPLSYEGQNRAVTRQDYETLILKDYPAIDAVRVWGGEDNDPPQYGRVFVSIKPQEGTVLSTTTKEYIRSVIIRKRNLISVDVVMVDPDYIYLVIDSIVKYRSSLTSDTAGAIQQTVIDEIVDFGEEELNKFDTYFRFSKMVRRIDDAHTSIQNSLTDIRLKYKLYPSLTVAAQYVVQFNNAIESNLTSLGVPTLQSSSFRYQGLTCYLQDDQEGNVQIYRLVDGNKVIVQRTAGTIDYDTGKVTINNFLPTQITSGDEFIEISVRPLEQDIVTLRNQLMIIEEDDVTINLVDEDVE